MGLLTSSTSITQYRIKGKLKTPVTETVYKGLKQHIIKDIDSSEAQKTFGWTSFETPYAPDFKGSSFVLDTYFVFSLRIDKKNIPPKIIRKHFTEEEKKHLARTGQEYLSRNEKRSLKDNVINVLSTRIPATPNVFDIIWRYEEASLWFFSNLKEANEDFETLFFRSFNLTPIRLFPYTAADLTAELSDAERDRLKNISPSTFME